MRGTPLLMISRLRLIRDHPRVCGEHSTSSKPPLVVSGSSPRMRGTPFTHFSRVERVGIIPAYAGNTFKLCNVSWDMGDHPRVCGEHRKRRPISSGAWRIIPAYAGNTSTPSVAPPPPRDHPRVCGEHKSSIRVCGNSEGSSPRMRGTPNIRPLAGKGDGIIPAYAGNTWTYPR